MTSKPYHVPVLLTESVQALITNTDGVYVDTTFGGGGHSIHILEKLSEQGRLIAFDQDEDAEKNKPSDERLTFIRQNFRYLQKYLRVAGHSKVDGILADLGVSSYQIDHGPRGFSYQSPDNLDMRMDFSEGITAFDIVKSYSAEQLQRLFSENGEVRNAKTLAQHIVQNRSQLKNSETAAFLELIKPLVRGKPNRYLAQVFQALRIEVNDEFNALRDLLKSSLNVLRTGGRLVVISYHSLEDRIVKQFLKTGDFSGELQTDEYGNIHRPFKQVDGKFILPSQDEIKRNPRARSAKMRIVEKIA